MRIGENLSPPLQNAAAVLWILGYGLCFIAAISALWGWYVVGWISCAVLVALAIDERKTIRQTLRNSSARKADRMFAWYLLALTCAAICANAIWLILWLAGVHR